MHTPATNQGRKLERVQHEHRDETLRRVADATSSAVGEDFFRSLARHLSHVLQARLAFISELKADRRVSVTALWDGTAFGRSFEYETQGTPCERVFEEGFAYYPSHLREQFPQDRWLQQRGLESYIAIPLYDSGGKPIGHMGAMHDAAMDDELPRESILRIFAARAASELERKRKDDALLEKTAQLENAHQKLSSLHSITVAASQSLDLKMVLQAVVRKITEVFMLDATRIFLLDRDKNEFHLMASDTPGGITFPTVVPRRQGILATTVDSGEPVIFRDIQSDLGYEKLTHARSAQKQQFRFLAAFPVQARGKVLGVLVCNDRGARYLPPDEVQLVESIAGQVGVAIANAQLYEQSRRQAVENSELLLRAEQRARELAALNTVINAIGGSLDLSQILEKALDAILDVTGMEVGYMRLLEGLPPRLNLKAHRGLSPMILEVLRRGTRAGGVSEQVFFTKRSIILDKSSVQATGDPRSQTLVEGIEAYAWVPITSKDRVVGIINVGTGDSKAVDSRHVALLESIGASLGIALEKAALYRESQKKEEIQRIVKELSQDITLLDIDTLLAKLTAQVIQLLKVDLADIRMLAGESWQVKCLSGIDPRAIPPADFIPEGRSEWIVKNRRALMIPDITRHTEIPGGKTLKRIGIRGYLGVPLFSRKGEVMGVLRALTYQSRGFAQDEIELLQQFANGAAVAIENTLLFEQVQAGHEQMQRLSRRLVEAQETERRAIARELHDEIGQILTGLKLMLQTSDGLSAKQFQKRLHKAQGLINELFTRVRALSVDLRPAMLDDLGLLPTLTWHFERFTAQTGVAVRFKHSGIQDKRFSPDLETAAYRIIQEALTNVARHANAAEAAVEVLATPQALTLEVRDRGCGFDFKAASRSGKGSGLGGMSERAMSLGGGLAIESRTERGTRLMATLPIGNIGNDPSAKGQRL